jgi:hypothetical protein
MHAFMDQDTGQWFKQKELRSLGDQGQIMPEDLRQQLFSTAVRGQREEADRQQKAQDKFRKQMGDEFVKEGYDRLNGMKLDADGRPVPLDRAFVEAAKPFVTPEEYKGLTLALVNGSTHDNPEALITLTRAETTMDAESFANLANTFMRNKLITNATYTTAMSRNRGYLEKGGPESPYKFGDNIISALDPGLFGKTNFVTAAAYRNAKADYYAWATTFEQKFKRPMTSYDAYRMAHYVVDHYKLVNANEMKQAVGTSRYFDKDPESLTQDDLNRYELKFAQDVAVGKYSKLEAVMESDRLNSWRQILTNERSISEGREGRRADPVPFPDFTRDQPIGAGAVPPAEVPAGNPVEWPVYPQSWPDPASGRAAVAVPHRGTFRAPGRAQPAFGDRWPGGQ